MMLTRLKRLKTRDGLEVCTRSPSATAPRQPSVDARVPRAHARIAAEVARLADGRQVEPAELRLEDLNSRWRLLALGEHVRAVSLARKVEVRIDARENVERPPRRQLDNRREGEVG